MDAKEITRRVDEYIEVRTRRKELASATAALEEVEKKLKKQLIEISFSIETKTLPGKLGHVERTRKVKPTARNWDAVYEYIHKYKAFDLLQKRLTETAVKSRWDDSVQIPGIEAFPVDDLTVVGESE